MKKICWALLLVFMFGAGASEAVMVKTKDGKNYPKNEVLYEEGAKMPERFSLEKIEEIWRRLSAATGFSAYVMYEGKPDVVNAYITRSGDGDYLVVMCLGLLNVLENDDEVAGVLAHEMGHGVRDHLSKAMQNRVGLTVGANILGALLGRGALTELIVGVGTTLAAQGYSRGQEVEADDCGVEFAAKAGFNPMGLYHSIESMSKAGKVTPPSGFNSHPPTERRMQHLKAQAQHWGSHDYDEQPEPAPVEKTPELVAKVPTAPDGIDVIDSFPVNKAERGVLKDIFNSSRAFYEQKKYNEALIGFSRGVDFYEGNYLFALWAARSAKELGNRAAMRIWTNKALSINPDYKPALEFKKKFVK